MRRNELNFEGQNIYVGIDVHKKSWVVTIMSKELEYKTFHQESSAEKLYSYLQRNFPNADYYSAYESGFCGFSAHRQLESLGIKNIVVNAADVPTTGKEKIQKTDKRDSRKIARSLSKGELKGIYVPSLRSEADRSLLRSRYAIRKDLAREKIRIKSKLNYYGIKHPEIFSSNASHWSQRYLNWLKNIPMEYETGRTSFDILIKGVEEFRKLLLEINMEIRALSRSETYKIDYELISSVPGIGLTTGMTFLTEIEDINRFCDTDHFAAYIGLVPSCHSTGEKENNGDITPRSNKFMRQLIIEDAWIAAAKDPALHLAYLKLCKRMEPNRAIIRIARKLINRIYYALKNKRIYEYGVTE